VSTLPWFALICCKCEPNNRTRNEKKTKTHNSTDQIQKLATEKKQNHISAVAVRKTTNL
jgi:hypothetical protein